MIRAAFVGASVALACVLSTNAAAGIVFQFLPTNPKAGTKYITVKAIAAPSGYEGVQVPYADQTLKLYLIRHADAPSVHSVHDPRLIPLGRFALIDTRYRLPHLRTGSYAMAAECISCKRHAFYVIGVGVDKWGIAPLMLLHASATPSGFPVWPLILAAAVVLLVALAGVIIAVQRRRSISEHRRQLAALAE